MRGLWEAVDAFLVDNPSISRTQWYDKWRRTKIFYNNFEISATSIWTSTGYQQYVDYIDRRGGIYYVRWGDAPIKTIGITLFVDQNKTHLFKDIGYRHNVYTNKGRGR
jgi:alpha 1,2-mannosyltransferase